MNKRGILSLIQIFILLTSIVAVSVLSSERVSSADKIITDYCNENPINFFCKDKTNDPQDEHLDLRTLSSATLPTTISKSQKYYEEIFGKGSAAPKGAKGGSAKTKYTIEGSKPLSSGFGYSVSNIIGNAAYAAGIYIFIKSVGGMFVDDDGALTKALSGAAFGGIVGGKS